MNALLLLAGALGAGLVRPAPMLEPDSLLILAAYLLGIWTLYLHAVR